MSIPAYINNNSNNQNIAVTGNNYTKCIWFAHCS